MNFIPGNSYCHRAPNSNSERRQLKTGFLDETRFLATGIQMGGGGVTAVSPAANR